MEQVPKNHPDRYPMVKKDQIAQIDCRRIACKYNAGAGNCTNVSPAITLSVGATSGQINAVCWSFKPKDDEKQTPDNTNNAG